MFYTDELRGGEINKEIERVKRDGRGEENGRILFYRRPFAGICVFAWFYNSRAARVTLRRVKKLDGDGSNC